MDKDKWAKSTDRTYLFCLPDSKKREGEGPFGVPPSARVLSPARKNFCSDRTETMTYRCPRQMKHKAYGAQPASVRHQGNPFSIKDSRTRPRLPTKNRNHLQGSWFPASHRGARQPEARRKKDREQEILLFPVLHPSPVPQPLPHEQRRGPSASEKPSMSPALSSSPIKVFGKDGGSLRGEGNLLCASQKVPFPPQKTSALRPIPVPPARTMPGGRPPARPSCSWCRWP